MKKGKMLLQNLKGEGWNFSSIEECLGHLNEKFAKLLRDETDPNLAFKQLNTQYNGLLEGRLLYKVVSKKDGWKIVQGHAFKEERVSRYVLALELWMEESNQDLLDFKKLYITTEDFISKMEKIIRSLAEENQLSPKQTLARLQNTLCWNNILLLEGEDVVPELICIEDILNGK